MFSFVAYILSTNFSHCIIFFSTRQGDNVSQGWGGSQEDTGISSLESLGKLWHVREHIVILLWAALTSSFAPFGRSGRLTHATMHVLLLLLVIVVILLLLLLFVVVRVVVQLNQINIDFPDELWQNVSIKLFGRAIRNVALYNKFSNI